MIWLGVRQQAKVSICLSIFLEIKTCHYKMHGNESESCLKKKQKTSYYYYKKSQFAKVDCLQNTDSDRKNCLT